MADLVGIDPEIGEFALVRLDDDLDHAAFLRWKPAMVTP
jgi:hypothetical protein